MPHHEKSLSCSVILSWKFDVSSESVMPCLHRISNTNYAADSSHWTCHHRIHIFFTIIHLWSSQSVGKQIQSLDSMVSCRLIAIAGTTFLMPCHPLKVTRTHFLWKSDAIDSYFTITVTLLEQFVGDCLNYNHYGTCIAVLVMAATETVLLFKRPCCIAICEGNPSVTGGFPSQTISGASRNLSNVQRIR